MNKDRIKSQDSQGRWLFRTSAILWAMWGIVHTLAGVMTVLQSSSGKVTEAVHAITSKVEIENLRMEYPEAVGAVVSQHGFNLLWFGLVTLLASPMVWKRKRLAVYLACLVGGLADLGYFIFIDLGGYATPPGPQMTWICAGAIITGLAAVRIQSRASSQSTDSA